MYKVAATHNVALEAATDPLFRRAGLVLTDAGAYSSPTKKAGSGAGLSVVLRSEI